MGAFLAIAKGMNEPLKRYETEELPTSPESLMAQLKALGIEFSYCEHKAVFTVAESEAVDKDIPGTHCRNLFLRDDKKSNFLLCLQNATEVDIKKLPAIIESKKLSFGSPDRLWDYLGVRPGSVCPYAIVNDTQKQVKICLDKSMMDHDVLNFHPLLNTMTIGVKPSDLVHFIESTGHTAYIVDLSEAAPDKE